MWLPGVQSIRWSKHNGIIVVTRSGEVWAKGARQTSIRYPLIWADAFQHCATSLPRPTRKVLMLGLGGGGALSSIFNALPHCEITVVEHDLLMLELAQTLNQNQPFPFPTVIIDDAYTAIKKGGIFDLILVDIFAGPRPSPLTQDYDFWHTLKQRLSQNGIVILNVAGYPNKAEIAQRIFPKHYSWQYRHNTLYALSL